MEFSMLVNLIADVAPVMFAGILVVAVGMFFLDRPATEKSVELKLVERERHAA